MSRATGEVPKQSAHPTENAHRAIWSWDSVSWGTHCVDCYPGNCPYRVFIKDGKVWREEPSGTFGVVEEGVPDMNPMGCNKGAAWSRQLTNPDRLRHPMRRAGERGSGEWEKISWDDALAELADAIIDAIEETGPETVMHEGTPEMTTVAPTHRFFATIGGTVTDFNATTNDFNVGMHITFGKYGLVSSIDDWFHSELFLIWHLNPAYTRIPHAHYVAEARYHGAEVVLIAPDYNASGMHADYFVPVEPGSDAALALGISQVLIEEGLLDEGFIVSQTDLSLLVREDTGRFLRSADIEEGGSEEQFYHLAGGAAAPADRGNLAFEGEQPQLTGRAVLPLATGGEVAVATAFTLLAEMLAGRYAPEQAGPLCGVNPETIRMLARKIAAHKTNILFGAAASKYYHGDLIERSLCLPLALTGNWGKKGTGIRSWSAGMFDGPALAMAKQQPGLAGAQPLIMAIEGMIGAAMAADPTATREIAGAALARMQSAMVPPFFFWYYHCGYRDRWATPGWGDPSMPRAFDEHVQEAVEAGWWSGLIKQPPEKEPRVFIDCGGNILRRTRGGKGMLLENLWPKLAKVAVIDTRLTGTAQHADLLLPAANHYEKIDFHIPTPHVMNLVFSDRSQAPEGEAKTEWEIFAALAGAIGERAAARGLESYKDAAGISRSYARLRDLYTIDGHYENAEVLADEMLRDSSHTGTLPAGTNLETMREQGHVRFAGWGILPYGESQGSPFPENETLAPLRGHVEDGRPYPTLTRRAQFYIDHPWFIEAGEAFPCHKDPPAMGGEYPFKLTSGHCRWSVHRMNIAHTELLQTHRGEPHVALNSQEAAEMRIADHEPVEVFNDSGSIVVKARLSGSVRPGQAIIYNGWETFQFPGWKATNELEAGMVKWLHLIGGYGHLSYSPTAWQPATVDRGTRISVRKAGGAG